MDYKKIFKTVLTEEAGEERIPVSPTDQEPAEVSDADHWNDSNPGIVDNEELGGQFAVEGLPEDITASYVNKIGEWREGINGVSSKLEEIYGFATDNADKPGAGEIFNIIGSGVESLITDLGTLEGQLKTLGKKIELSSKRESAKDK